MSDTDRPQPRIANDSRATNDPETADARIFIGGSSIIASTAIREDLYDKFSKHGKIKAMSIHTGYCFIQFSSPREAESAATEHGAVFHGMQLNVNISNKPKPPQFFGSKGPVKRRFDPPPRPMEPPKPEAPRGNHSEIVCMTPKQRFYAEEVEDRVKRLKISVDILFPKEGLPIIEILDDLSRRGTAFVLVIHPQNEQYRSITLNILHGKPEEHRNMPLEDAMVLLASNYDDYLLGKSEPTPQAKRQRKSYDEIPIPDGDHKAPDRGTQLLIDLLAEGKRLTVTEIDQITRYLQERRDHLTGGQKQDGADTKAKQAELQQKILDMIKKPEMAAVAGSMVQANNPWTGNPLNQSMMAALNSPGLAASIAGLSALQNPVGPSREVPPPAGVGGINLNSQNIQKALDSLIQNPDILRSIQGVKPAQGPPKPVGNLQNYQSYQGPAPNQYVPGTRNPW